jgi:hypothetical protein
LGFTWLSSAKSQKNEPNGRLRVGLRPKCFGDIGKPGEAPPEVLPGASRRSAKRFVSFDMLFVEITSGMPLLIDLSLEKSIRAKKKNTRIEIPPAAVLRDPRSVPPPVAVALQSQEKIEQACRVSAVCDVWQYAINHRVLIHQNL